MAFARVPAGLQARILEFNPLTTTTMEALVTTATNAIKTAALVIQQISVTASHRAISILSHVVGSLQEDGHFLRPIYLYAVATIQAIRFITYTQYAGIMASILHQGLDMGNDALTLFVSTLCLVEKVIRTMIGPSNAEFAVLAMYTAAVLVLSVLLLTVARILRVLLKAAVLIVPMPLQVWRFVTRTGRQRSPRQQAHDRDRSATPEAITDAILLQIGGLERRLNSI